MNRKKFILVHKINGACLYILLTVTVVNIEIDDQPTNQGRHNKHINYTTELVNNGSCILGQIVDR